MKRLTRIAENSPVADALQGVSGDGRDILKQLEKLKFKTLQCTNLTANNDAISKKVKQNVDIIDKVMSTLYSVCFNLDNIDLTPLYGDEQLKFNDDQTYNLNEEIPETAPPRSPKPEATEEQTDESKGEGDDSKEPPEEPAEEEPADEGEEE